MSNEFRTLSSAVIQGTLSAKGVIYAPGGNSNIWNQNGGSDLTLIQAASGNWDSTYTTVSSNSASWGIDTDTIYDDSLLQATSGSWNSAYTTVSSNSASWGIDTIYDDSLLQATSGSWDSAYTTVSSNSASWGIDTDTIYDDSLLQATSGSWNSTYTTTNSNSADWTSTYTTVNDLSSTWDDQADLSELQAASGSWNSTYTTVDTNSADWVTYSTGNISTANWVLDEDNLISNSSIQIPTQQSVKAYVDNIVTGINNFEGAYNASTDTPALTSGVGVQQGDTYYIETGGLFYNAQVDPGDLIIATIDNAALSGDWVIVNRNIQDELIDRWNTTYTTVDAESGSWDSTYTTVSSNSAAWGIDTIYDDTALQAASGDWNSTYTTVSSNSASWSGAGSGDFCSTTVLLNEVSACGGEMSIDGTLSASDIITTTLSADGVYFNTGADRPPELGELVWDETERTLDLGLEGGVVLQIGEEQLINVIAGEEIKDGQVVYASGAFSQGNTGKIVASLYSASSAEGVTPGAVDELFFIGVATQDIAQDASGYITTFGKVRNINVYDGNNVNSDIVGPDNVGGIGNDPDWPVGTVLYISTSAGRLTNTPPESPNKIIPTAMVISQSGNGHQRTLFVRQEHGYHIDELHDVRAINPQQNDVLAFNYTLSSWDNVTSNNWESTYTTVGSNSADWVTYSTNSISVANWVLDEDNLSSNDATKVPTQQSVKFYIDNVVTGINNLKGGYDAGTDTPQLDTTPTVTITQGDSYYITASGDFFATAVDPGDLIIATIDNAALSGDWVIVNRNIQDELIDRWNTTYTTVDAESANWDSTYTTVSSNSAAWGIDTIYDDTSVTELQAASANWESTYTTVLNESGSWDSTYTTVDAESANWESTYTTVSSNSANWGPAGLPEATATVYVTQDGDVAYDGLSITQAKDTISDAITVASSLITGGATAVNIEVLDSSDYTEDINLGDGMILNGPTATLKGIITTDASSTTHVILKEQQSVNTSTDLVNPGNSGTLFYKANRVTVSSSCRAIYAENASTRIYADIDTIEVGSSSFGLVAGAGLLFAQVKYIELVGSGATGIACISSGSVSATVEWISEFGPQNAIGIDCQAGEVSVDTKNIGVSSTSGRSYKVTSGTLRLTAIRLVGNTQGTPDFLLTESNYNNDDWDSTYTTVGSNSANWDNANLQQTITSSASALTLDVNSGNSAITTLTENITSFTIQNASAGDTGIIIISSDGGGWTFPDQDSLGATHVIHTGSTDSFTSLTTATSSAISMGWYCDGTNNYLYMSDPT